MRPSTASRRLALALALALPPAVPAVAQGAPADTRNALPSLGDSADEGLTVSAERRLGDRIMRELRRDADYLDDPVLLDYLARMWDGLVVAARARGDVPPELAERFAWEPFLVRDRSVNAFALPGGYIGVHLGLVAVTATPDELASVLAHELSHVSQRHIARSVDAGKATSFAGIAGMILGVLVASRSPEAAQALITGGQAVAVQGQLNFSRDMEREADRVGFGVLTGAGYAPGGMSAMFEKLLQAARLNDSQNFPYLRSHPLTTERIGEARSRLGVDGAAPPPRTLVYALMQARARVLMDPRDAALQRAQDFDRTVAAVSGAPLERAAALYTSALASILRRDAARADAAIAAARPLVDGDAAARQLLDLLALQGLIERGDAAAAAALLERAALPEARPTLLARGQVALLPGAAAADQRRAAERLQTWVALHGADALAWGQLAQLWSRLGEPLRSVRAEAEARAAVGDVVGAIERLRAGQRLARSARSSEGVEATVIDARLRELERLRREIVEEERRG
ncbi:MAG TPA: M48 family metalloprotease [Methylibium sp.]|nr:M48 family metalloprotease [Methylibium sp.]